jgi:signal transduction histidine kinase
MAAWSALAIAVIFRLVCCMEFWRESMSIGFAAAWPSQFAFLLLLSTAVAAACALLHDRALAFLVVLLLFVIDVVMCVPEADRIVLRFFLLSSDIMTAALCLRPRLNAVFAAALVCAAFLLMNPVLVFGIPAVAPAIPLRLAFCAVLALVAACGLAFKRHIDGSIMRGEELAHLGTTIGQLTRANVSFQDYAHCIEERASEIERKRITSDIHDTIGYTLTNIIMMTQEAKMRAAPVDKELASLLETTRVQAQDGLRQTRRALRALREAAPPELDFLQTVAKLAATFEKATGVKVDVDLLELPASIPGPASLAIYRMIQEGLTNAIRHGNASKIRISFRVDGNQDLVVDLFDNGKGSNGSEPGLGLLGMRERIEAVDGRFSAGDFADGFRVTAWLPLPREGMGHE